MVWSYKIEQTVNEIKVKVLYFNLYFSFLFTRKNYLTLIDKYKNKIFKYKIHYINIIILLMV